MFDHDIYFDSVRSSLFGGSLTQGQVDGQEAILRAWELYLDDQDVRWLAYMLATTYHETSKEMLPIEEYSKGEGQPYGEEDPETGETYYGRGFVQLTWRENYERADKELVHEDAQSLVWNADNALLPGIAARVMWFGMSQGWFRTDDEGPQTLARYFGDYVNDPYGAREIINGDKGKIPAWSDGVSIGVLIEGYYNHFLAALKDAVVEDLQPEEDIVEIDIRMPEGMSFRVTINDQELS